MSQKTVRVKQFVPGKNNYLWVYIIVALLVVNLVVLVVFANAGSKPDRPQLQIVVQTQLPVNTVQDRIVTATPAPVVNPLATVTAYPMPTNTLAPTPTATPTPVTTPRPPHSPSPFELNYTYAAETANAK